MNRTCRERAENTPRSDRSTSLAYSPHAIVCIANFLEITLNAFDIFGTLPHPDLSPRRTININFVCRMSRVVCQGLMQGASLTPVHIGSSKLPMLNQLQLTTSYACCNLLHAPVNLNMLKPSLHPKTDDIRSLMDDITSTQR